METDLLVYGSSEGALCAAVRAARNGLQTVLAGPRQGLGGVLPSLGAIETHISGTRSPLVDDFRSAVIEHYRIRYGKGSPQYQDCIDLEVNNPMVTFEPKVAKEILEHWAATTPNLRVERGSKLISIKQNEGSLNSVRLRNREGIEFEVQAKYFIDASYEGDLGALAGVEYRVGRESRAEFAEPHAGKMFTRWLEGRYPLAAVEGSLKILPKWTTMGLYSGSTGAGDDEIQDYSYRLCLCSRPDNRIIIKKPDGYDRDWYAPLLLPVAEKSRGGYRFQHRFLTQSLETMVDADHIFHGHALPNRKRSWNATNYTGMGKQYPEGSDRVRREIEEVHLQHALGLMYFLQNDLEVPEKVRAAAREWGLAADEFVETGCIPEQIYVREARRMLGRFIISERDAESAIGTERAPVHGDSVAIVEFPLDSLACTPERSYGSLPDGQFFLTEQTRPGQVPYRSLLPRSINNLLVTGTMSATHVAWATVRQSPTQMHIAEAAGFAVALAKETGVPPALINVDTLQRILAQNRSIITFFNDIDSAQDPRAPAFQYFGARGFFPNYDSCPDRFLTQAVASAWVEAVKAIRAGEFHDPAAFSRTIAELEKTPRPISRKAWESSLSDAFALKAGIVSSDEPPTRGEACVRLFGILS